MYTLEYTHIHTLHNTPTFIEGKAQAVTYVNDWINNEYWAVIKAHNPQHLLWLSVLDRP